MGTHGVLLCEGLDELVPASCYMRWHLAVDAVVWVTASCSFLGSGTSLGHTNPGWQWSHQSPVIIHVLEPRSLKMSTAPDPGLVSGNFRVRPGLAGE